jgi:outer membrane cobalamin receptor
VKGDAFGQHDSRLQEAANAHYQKPHSLGSVFGTFSGGMTYLDNQINLKLYGRDLRVPRDLRTWAGARVANEGWYGQENLVLSGGKLRIDFGARYDALQFRIQDRIAEDGVRVSRNGGAFQPKASIAYTPRLSLPFTLHANYGRAITSSNVRSLFEQPGSPLQATTDFYQFGTSHNYKRFSAATSWFRIDRSNETLYVADSGTTEFTGPSRSYGFEVKSSVQFSRSFSWNGSITKVANAFYRNTNPREYIDRAPHFTAYSALTVSGYRGWSGSLRFRTINHYLLNGEEADTGEYISGNSVFDFSVSRTLNRWLEFNFAIDNILNKSYFETYERYTSRLPGQDAMERAHGTTGYPRTFIGGVTIRLFPKKL